MTMMAPLQVQATPAQADPEISRLLGLTPQQRQLEYETAKDQAQLHIIAAAKAAVAMKLSGDEFFIPDRLYRIYEAFAYGRMIPEFAGYLHDRKRNWLLEKLMLLPPEAQQQIHAENAIPVYELGEDGEPARRNIPLEVVTPPQLNRAIEIIDKDTSGRPICHLAPGNKQINMLREQQTGKRVSESSHPWKYDQKTGSLVIRRGCVIDAANLGDILKLHRKNSR